MVKSKKVIKVPDEVLNEPGLEPVYPEALIPIGRAGSAMQATSKFLQGNEYFDRAIEAAEKPYAAVKKAFGYSKGGKVKSKPRGVGCAQRGHGKGKMR